MTAKESPAMTFHLIANAHLDPVWLWDWREGLNQGLITCRTVLDLMDEDPDLTFNRGEAAIYLHIEQADPDAFARIERYVRCGRWDFVGGTWVQADQNLPASETLVRQFTRGQRYFAARFGRPARAAWSADCFGHAAGLPEILAAAGIQYFAFTRPAPQTLPLARPAFWWIGPGGSRILAYRPLGDWYGSERSEMTGRLDRTLAASAGLELRTVGVFYGLGDHGGGPTRRQLADIDAWAAAHPEVRVVHSTIHRFFDELYQEVGGLAVPLPEVKGELNYLLRGCYSSMARFKFAYRKAEALLSRAETTQTAIGLGVRHARVDLGEAWDVLLLNSFHDILPGTSIERAYEDQITHLGSGIHRAQAAELAALNALAAQVDTRVLPAAGQDLPTGVAALVWNPHPYPFDGFVEFEGCVDDRPLPAYRERRAGDLPLRLLGHDKQPLPFQKVAVESLFMLEAQWRTRVVAPIELPPLGWSTLELGFFRDAPTPAAPPAHEQAGAARDGGSYRIANATFQIEAARGAAGIKISRLGKPFLGGDGLGAAIFADPWGSWGGEEDAVATDTPSEMWAVTEVHILEQGPWRAALWVRLAGLRSRLDLIFYLYAGRDAVDVSARVHLDERSARLRLLFPVSGAAEFDVPGARVVRAPGGELPGHRWVRLADRSLGFASDALYSFNLDGRQLRATVARATRYADSQARRAGSEPWLAATDVGELRFRFLIAPGNDALPRLARELEQPVSAQLVAAKAGRLGSRGSLAELRPRTLELLALKPAEDGHGCILRLQETAGRTTRPRLTLLGETVVLSPVKGRRIASYRLARMGDRWTARACDAAEWPV